MKKLNQSVCIECGKTYAEEVDPNSLGAIYWPEAKSDSPTCPECIRKMSPVDQELRNRAIEEFEKNNI